jgi:hypothetical protein
MKRAATSGSGCIKWLTPNEKSKRFAWDAERKAWKLVQGLGGFRLERFYGRTATPAKTPGVDFVAGSTLVGKKILLKGPFLDDNFQPLGRSPKQIADDLNPKTRNNTAADEFVINTFGLQDLEAAELQQLIVTRTKKVTFLKNR